MRVPGQRFAHRRIASAVSPRLRRHAAALAYSALPGASLRPFKAPRQLFRSLRQQRPAKQELRRGIFRVQLCQHRQVPRGFVHAIEMIERKGKVESRIRQLRVQPHRRAEPVERLLELPFPEQHQPQVAVIPPRAWSEMDGLFIGFARRIVVAQFDQRTAHVGKGVGELRIHTNRRFVLPQRLLQLAPLLQRTADSLVGDGVRPGDLKRSTEEPFGVHPELALIAHTEPKGHE